MKTQYIEKSDEGTFYYADKKMTKLHREDGPAIESPDGEEWWVNGRRHNEDGPAVAWTTVGIEEYWLGGHQVTKSEWEVRTKKPVITCEGKVVEIDGRRFKLVLID